MPPEFGRFMTAMTKKSAPASNDKLATGPAGRLLAWYDQHRRVLPWRAAKGKRPDPYAVWLSEIMLQQTTVQTVGPYFGKFIARWPRVGDLAAAPLEEVLREWAGLGYYARARNLHACAVRVTRDFGGRFPQTLEGLRALPGIGPYTAAAIAAIAFDLPAAAVDGNAERVISRLRKIETPLPAAKALITAETQSLVPAIRPGDFAQALMDLGATVCSPRNPSCTLCPWQSDCAGRAAGIADSLPRKAPKTAQPVRYGAAFRLFNADGKLYARRRPPKGLLGGMLEIPSSPWAAEEPARPLEHAPTPARWRKRHGTVSHTFTHFHLILTVYDADLPPGTALAGDWIAPDALDQAGFPTVMRKIAQHGKRS